VQARHSAANPQLSDCSPRGSPHDHWHFGASTFVARFSRNEPERRSQFFALDLHDRDDFAGPEEHGVAAAVILASARVSYVIGDLRLPFVVDPFFVVGVQHFDGWVRFRFAVFPVEPFFFGAQPFPARVEDFVFPAFFGRSLFRYRDRVSRSFWGTGNSATAGSRR
jgi:hypothetical protein